MTSFARAANQQSDKKKLDIAFLYSDPLIFISDEKQIKPFPQTIDTEGEFSRLCRFLEERNQGMTVTVKRDAANNRTLSQIINESPTIIHISCHGDMKPDPISKKY